MAATAPTVRTRAEDGVVVVEALGRWALVADAGERERLARELGEVPSAADCVWDLHGVETMDSAGALLLWNAWGRREPAGLRCDEALRPLFRRLSHLPEEMPRRRAGVVDLLATCGRGIVGAFGTAGGLALLFGQVVLAAGYVIAHPRLIPWRELSATIYKAGVRSLALVGLLSLLVGMVMAYQMGLTISRYGANSAIVSVLGLAVLREIGPWITAILIAGRTGSAITAEIGAMRITGELDALRTFGISPIVRLALPRVAGLAIALPLLTVWADFTGLLGGVIVADTVLGVSPEVFLSRLPHEVELVNLAIGIAKGVLFGIVIGLVGSYYGLRTEASTASLSSQTTGSVVVSLALVVLVDGAAGALLVDVGLF